MSEARVKLMEAIARKRTVTARYNGAVIELAPHVLFERRGDLFVSALNLSKNWRSPDERQLGQFNLKGLAMTELTDEEFEHLPSYDAKAPNEEDTLVFAL